MKFLTLVFVSLFCCNLFAEDATLKSVLVKEEAKSPCSSCGGHNVTYRNKRNIAPCAVPKVVNVCLCKTCCVDCEKVTVAENVGVEVCVPPCSCKENTRTRRNGKVTVYDYGKYEVVVSVDRDNDIEVNYRKRLFNR